MGNDFGFSYQRENKRDKEEDQVTTSAGKKDNTDSTVTKTTAASTSVRESEWDHYTTEGLAETTKLNNQTYLCLWKTTMGESCPQVENTHAQSLQGKTVLTNTRHSRPWPDTNN